MKDKVRQVRNAEECHRRVNRDQDQDGLMNDLSVWARIRQVGRAVRELGKVGLDGGNYREGPKPKLEIRRVSFYTIVTCHKNVKCSFKRMVEYLRFLCFLSLSPYIYKDILKGLATNIVY